MECEPDEGFPGLYSGFSSVTHDRGNCWVSETSPVTFLMMDETGRIITVWCIPKEVYVTIRGPKVLSLCCWLVLS